MTQERTATVLCQQIMNHFEPGKVIVHKSTLWDIHIDDTSNRIPKISIVFKSDYDLYHHTQLMILGALLLKDLLEYGDWDTDDISWNLNIGVDYKGLPNHITKNVEYLPTENGEYSWLTLELTDYLS